MNTKPNQNRWWVDVIQIVIAWHLVIVFMSISMGSGIAWFLLGPKLSKDTSYAFQTDLINLDKKPKIEVVILGDEIFSQSLSTILKETNIEYAVIDAPRVTLSDLLASLFELNKSSIEVILIQNSPHLWTDINFKFKQNINLSRYLNSSNLFFGKDPERIFWSLLKDWAHSPAKQWSSDRPKFLRNAPPKYPPQRNANIWKRLLKDQNKWDSKLVWVSDFSQFTTDFHIDDNVGNTNRVLSPDRTLTGMRFSTMGDILSLLETMFDR